MTGEKIFIVRLAEDERAHLGSIVRAGRVAGYKRIHAQILLLCDQGDHGPAWSDPRVAKAIGVSTGTVHNVRSRLVEQGLEAALGRKKQEHPSRPRKLDGKAEARLIALACSSAPEGRARWTMRLLAGELVNLELVESISAECVRRTLKKTSSSRT